MTGQIMAEYLHWLNNIMAAQNRHILLFMGDFSSHELGVQIVGGRDALSNVKVRWLPPNTTSHWQPIGVIHNFKLHYRRQWVFYDLDPNKTVTLFHGQSMLQKTSLNQLRSTGVGKSREMYSRRGLSRSIERRPRTWTTVWWGTQRNMLAIESLPKITNPPLKLYPY